MNQIVHINKAEWESVLKKEGAEWLDYLYEHILSAEGGTLTLDNMNRLTSDQITLYAYKTFRDEMLEGGFCQLIQNGYGPFIFKNPFARTLKLWGMKELAKIVRKGNDIYRKNEADLTRERSEDEFMAMYEDYEVFDKWEDDYIENEEQFTDDVKVYVLEHPEEFYTLEV